MLKACRVTYFFSHYLSECPLLTHGENAVGIYRWLGNFNGKAVLGLSTLRRCVSLINGNPKEKLGLIVGQLLALPLRFFNLSFQVSHGIACNFV